MSTQSGPGRHPTRRSGRFL